MLDHNNRFGGRGAFVAAEVLLDLRGGDDRYRNDLWGCSSILHDMDVGADWSSLVGGGSINFWYKVTSSR